MKLQFKATGAGPLIYAISGETINGIDLSVIEHGGAFVGNETTRAAGVRDAYRDASGVLHVTLKQPTIASKLPGRKAHWRGTGQWIDATSYDPNACYVEPTGVFDLTEGADYVLAIGTDCAGTQGWTIKEPEHA